MQIILNKEEEWPTTYRKCLSEVISCFAPVIAYMSDDALYQLYRGVLKLLKEADHAQFNKWYKPKWDQWVESDRYGGKTGHYFRQHIFDMILSFEGHFRLHGYGIFKGSRTAGKTKTVGENSLGNPEVLSICSHITPKEDWEALEKLGIHKFKRRKWPCQKKMRRRKW